MKIAQMLESRAYKHAYHAFERVSKRERRIKGFLVILCNVKIVNALIFLVYPNKVVSSRLFEISVKNRLPYSTGVKTQNVPTIFST